MTPRPSKQPMLEADFQARVIAYAELNGWRVFHPRPARIGKKIATWQAGHKGYPDLTLARDGVVLFVELKQDGKYPSPDQRSWRDAIGPQWRLWRPADWPAVKAELDRPRRRPASPVPAQNETGVPSHQRDVYGDPGAFGGDAA